MKHDWKIRPFEDSIVKVKYTTKISSNDYLKQGLYPIVSQEEGLISGYWNNEEDVFKVSTPVVIFGDHTRILKYVDFDFVLGADGVKIVQPIESINAKFFKLYLESCKIPSLGYSRHYKLLKELQVPIPPREEQERIVAESDCLSGVIEKKREQLRELDALAQSIFYTMFGDPITNEKGWEVKTIKEVAPQQEYKGDVPYQNGRYWLLNLDMVVPQTGEVIEQCLFEKEEIGNSTIKFNSDNVLYSKLRPYLNKVVVPNEIGYATSELVPLCPKKDVLNRVFFASLLRSPHFVKYISGKVAGAKMPRVAMSEFREFAVILPPFTLQQKFADKIEAIEKQKELIKQSITQTEELFNARMAYYFN